MESAAVHVQTLHTTYSVSVVVAMDKRRVRVRLRVYLWTISRNERFTARGTTFYLPLVTTSSKYIEHNTNRTINSDMDLKKLLNSRTVYLSLNSSLLLTKLGLPLTKLQSNTIVIKIFHSTHFRCPKPVPSGPSS